MRPIDLSVVLEGWCSLREGDVADLDIVVRPLVAVSNSVSLVSMSRARPGCASRVRGVAAGGTYKSLMVPTSSTTSLGRTLKPEASTSISPLSDMLDLVDG